MIDVTPNIPEVVAEVRALFEHYEQALVEKNVHVLDATFWDSPHTIRYAVTEHGYGFAQIHAHRMARPPGPGTKEKRIRLEILTLAVLGQLNPTNNWHRIAREWMYGDDPVTALGREEAAFYSR